MKNLKRAALAAGVASLFLLGGCGSSNNDFVFSNNQGQIIQPDPVDPVDPVDPPVAAADTFVALGNATLNQSAANGVLSNDTVNGGAVEPFQGTTGAGGALNLAADGSFTYTPANGFLGSDRFNYTLTNESGSSETSALIVVSNRGVFVNTSAATNGDGSQASPFDNLADALTASRSGDTVFVFGGSTINGQIIVPVGVNLVGQGVGLVAAQTIVEAGTQPTLTGPVIPTSNNVITGFRIAGSASRGVDMESMPSFGNQERVASNITVRSNLFENNSEEHIYVEQAFGPVFVESNTFEEPAVGFDAVFHDFQSGDRSTNITIDNNTFSTDGTNSVGRAIRVETPGSRAHQVNIRGNTITGANTTSSFADGIRIGTQGAGVNNADIRDNNISGVENDGIFFGAPVGGTEGNSTLSCDLFNNSISQCGVNNLAFDYDRGSDPKVFNVFGNTFTSSEGDAINLSLDGGANVRILASNNVISSSANDGVNVSHEGGADATLIFQANEFTDNGGDGFESFSTDTGINSFLVAFRGNIFTNSGGNDLLFRAENGNSNDCFDIEGNSFSSDVSLNPLSANTFTVEQFSAGLDTVNTFLSGSITTTGNAIVNANDGDCNIE